MKIKLKALARIVVEGHVREKGEEFTTKNEILARRLCEGLHLCSYEGTIEEPTKKLGKK